MVPGYIPCFSCQLYLNQAVSLVRIHFDTLYKTECTIHEFLCWVLIVVTSLHANSLFIVLLIQRSPWLLHPLVIKD